MIRSSYTVEGDVMVKREVVCEHCGHKWETPVPFDVTMCPNCHKHTHISPPGGNKPEGKSAKKV
jgi:Zn finger protein HypA/HybF involved in hydrogenase expression